MDIMKRKIILGIDYGDKRLGLALAETGSMAIPYKILDNSPDLFSRLENIIKEENISVIVVGLPHSLSGKNNDRLQITQKFIDDLKKHFSLEVATVDEQMTSVLYEKQGVKKDLDKYSAAAILETYLNINSL